MQRLSFVFAALACVGFCQNVSAHALFSDAQNLAVTVCPDLLAPDSLVQRISGDLELIRAQYPAVAHIHFNRCYHELPGAVSVLLTAEARAAFLAGEHEELNALHAQIGTPEVEPGACDYIDLYFTQPYNPEVLPSLYWSIDGVRFAGVAPGCIGDRDDIAILADGIYQFRRAWGENCLCGCEFEHVWVFSITDGQATLVDEHGNDLVPVLRSTWGAIKARYR